MKVKFPHALLPHRPAQPAIFTSRSAIHQRGASLIELAVLTMLILTFIVTALFRIWELRVTAERVGIEQVVGTLKSALGIELAASVVKHRSQADLTRFHHCNPMAFLDPAPVNYIGEYEATPEEAEAGSWYFNRRDATLEYRVRFSDYFSSSNADNPSMVRFQVQLEYSDLNHNGTFEPAIDSASALTLVTLDNYHWLSQDEAAAE